MRVRITKRATVQGGAPARDMADHIPGRQQPDGFSLPVEYTIEGDLVRPIVVGESVVVKRDLRNGVKAEGFFTSSPVTKIDNNTFHTRNSVYDFEEISYCLDHCE